MLVELIKNHKTHFYNSKLHVPLAKLNCNAMLSKNENLIAFPRNNNDTLTPRYLSFSPPFTVRHALTYLWTWRSEASCTNPLSRITSNITITKNRNKISAYFLLDFSTWKPFHFFLLRWRCHSWNKKKNTTKRLIFGEQK